MSPILRKQRPDLPSKDERGRPRPRRPHASPRRLDLAAAELTGFPRHLSQHVGGFVITRARTARRAGWCRSRMQQRGRPHRHQQAGRGRSRAASVLKIDVHSARHADLRQEGLCVDRTALRPSVRCRHGAQPKIPRSTRCWRSCRPRSANTRSKAFAQMTMPRQTASARILRSR